MDIVWIMLMDRGWAFQQKLVTCRDVGFSDALKRRFRFSWWQTKELQSKQTADLIIGSLSVWRMKEAGVSGRGVVDV